MKGYFNILKKVCSKTENLFKLLQYKRKTPDKSTPQGRI